MSKRSFKSKQKKEATNFDWKIWSLPPTYTPPIDHPVFPLFFFQRVYVDFFFCHLCDECYSRSEFCFTYHGYQYCFNCYHEGELDLIKGECHPPLVPPTSSTKAEPESESAST